ncbi:hypothetical protein STSP_58090 [Streptomyces jeddahensis]|uniref:Uncharacterized protein n=1 Tax=Streptomyces jeddahensis TaxID=1716141 RepID=A0A177HKP5_9ACTN|nr:hypothetical protein STSP_58090 [Streptomyces jeddahensis]
MTTSRRRGTLPGTIDGPGGQAAALLPGPKDA